jgi:hypothetical protein
LALRIDNGEDDRLAIDDELLLPVLQHGLDNPRKRLV